MATLTHLLTGLSDSLDWLEHKTKSFFVVVAMLLYAGSLFLLAQKVSPLSDLDTFLVKALGNLSIPFGVILLQELLELLTAIPRSTLRSTCQQFEIVALVILRSFFKDFYKLNKAVTAGICWQGSPPLKVMPSSSSAMARMRPASTAGGMMTPAPVS